jgi:hypothetical protein
MAIGIARVGCCWRLNRPWKEGRNLDSFSFATTPLLVGLYFAISTCKTIVVVSLLSTISFGTADRSVDLRTYDRTCGHVALLDSCKGSAENRYNNVKFHLIVGSF